MGLPLWVSSKTVKLTDRHGNEQIFEADVPAVIHPALQRAAIAEGLTIFTGEIPVEVDNGMSVCEAIRALMESGDPKAFGTTGEPKLAGLKKILGRGVTDAERDEAWAQIKAEA